MNAAKDSREDRYGSAYRDFDLPLMRRLRAEAYGEDIGQHSWVTAEQLRADIARLGLTRASRLLDLGCGPCGPLTFVVRDVGCEGTGIELSPAALAVGWARAAALGIEPRIALHEGDLDDPLPLADGAFDAVMALDVVLHVRDRVALFREILRVLAPGGRFLFTDAGVVTGAITGEEITRRSAHGSTQFVAPGFDERALGQAGFRLIESEDRTQSVLANATGRRDALLAHRVEVEQLQGASDLERQLGYLATVIEISRRGALSRVMYLAERP
jgi:SAM-dependent methyltransferase